MPHFLSAILMTGGLSCIEAQCDTNLKKAEASRLYSVVNKNTVRGGGVRAGFNNAITSAHLIWFKCSRQFNVLAVRGVLF